MDIKNHPVVESCYGMVLALPKERQEWGIKETLAMLERNKVPQELRQVVEKESRKRLAAQQSQSN